MLVYVEFISRRPHVALEDFHTVARQGQEGWADAYGEDRLIVNLGRTWRIGPEPEYLAAWYTPNGGVERLGDWERIFKSGEADPFEKPMELVARLDSAGCYDPLLEPAPHRGGPYYAEYFDFAGGATRDDVRGWYEDRLRRHNGLQLPLLVDRIGKLGPGPRGLAIWALPSYAELDAIAREVGGEAPVCVETSGLYSDLGEETL